MDIYVVIQKNDDHIAYNFIFGEPITAVHIMDSFFTSEVSPADK